MLYKLLKFLEITSHITLTFKVQNDIGDNEIYGDDVGVLIRILGKLKILWY